MSKLATFTLALALTFNIACSKNEKVLVNPSTGEQVAVVEIEKGSKKGHLCSAMTKAGKPCTRRIADGKDKCWQHDGSH